jgi:2-C-methyl-D-erythritol 2,4-cyclodiphosphate synthase
VTRLGQGYDLHRLVSGRPLVLGGVRVPHARGLDGHSDADVLAHAVGDALLGALGDGDLGTHFPSSDERWRDASGATLLGEITRRVARSATSTRPSSRRSRAWRRSRHRSARAWRSSSGSTPRA